jgi:hypothetical protein
MYYQGQGHSQMGYSQEAAYFDQNTKQPFQPKQQPQYHQAPKNKLPNSQPINNPQIFNQPSNHAIFNPLQHNVENLMNNPMASMAVNYGSNLADQGKDYVSKNVTCSFKIIELNINIKFFSRNK